MRAAVVFTTHALRRMLEHRIRSEQVREVLERGEVIESYPDDTPLPSYLMLGTGAGRVLHVVAADDPAADRDHDLRARPPRVRDGLQDQEEALMRCVICKGGEVRPGTTSFTVERGEMTLVLKGIPARVCSQCGEAYFDEATTRRIEEIAERMQHTGVQVAVQDYAAA